jgi:DNA-binding MarR family transcriptional regulator
MTPTWAPVIQVPVSQAHTRPISFFLLVKKRMNHREFDIEEIRLSSRFSEFQRRNASRSSFPFLKGPIPWRWLCQAASLSGKALHVAVALRFLAGLNKSNGVALSGRVLKDLGVSRHASYRALRALEEAGLIFVERHSGRNPFVTIVEGGERD